MNTDEKGLGFIGVHRWPNLPFFEAGPGRLESQPAGKIACPTP
jgi:hypothetical protein